MRKLKIFQAVNIITTIIIGSLLHFVYAWSGNSKIVALFAAVNESTWEHLKLAFWPTLVFAVIGYFLFRKEIKNYCLAQAVAIYSIPLIIVGLFYGWLLFFPDNFLWDISIFVVAIIIGQLLAYKLMKIEREYRLANFFAAILIVLAIFAFSLYTFLPPHNFLFKDPVEGGYGL